jgi:hypothetical protein
MPCSPSRFSTSNLLMKKSKWYLTTFCVSLYSGDHDLCIPFTGTEAWVRSLGYGVVDSWRSWYFGGQVAGYDVLPSPLISFTLIIIIYMYIKLRMRSFHLKKGWIIYLPFDVLLLNNNNSARYNDLSSGSNLQSSLKRGATCMLVWLHFPWVAVLDFIGIKETYVWQLI